MSVNDDVVQSDRHAAIIGGMPVSSRRWLTAS
jgi:hypothetical protein